MAGYNNVQFAGAAILMAISQVVTGQYFPAILSLPLCIDVTGTAQMLFRVTKQFESAVLTSGRDITLQLVVRACSHAAMHIQARPSPSLSAWPAF